MAGTVKITKKAVDEAKPGLRERTIWDSAVHGFGLRVWPSGRKVYVFKYRVGGGRAGTMRKPVIGDHGSLTPDQARAIAAEWAEIVRKGGDPAGDRQAKREAPAMNELFDRYLSDHAEVHKAPRSVEDDRRIIAKQLRPAFGARKVHELDRAIVSRFHSRMKDRPIAANRALAVLSKALTLAELWGMRPDGSNPCRLVRRYKENARERVLTGEELAGLGQALADLLEGGANPDAVLAIRLAALSGWRIGEVLKLRWADVDLGTGTATLREAKAGTRNAVLTAPMAAYLAEAERRGAQVIPGRNPDRPLDYKAVHKVWARACERAKIADARPHDLRHTAATNAARGGASALIVRDLLGHRTLQMASRYVARGLDPVRSVADAVSGDIAAAMNRGTGGDVLPLKRG